MGLSEASTRSVLERLNEVGITHSPGQSSGRKGNWLSTKGMQLADRLRKYVNLETEISSDLFENKMWGIKIAKAAPRIKDGIKQRDDAIRAGAHGAITLVFTNNQWVFPDTKDDAKISGVSDASNEDVLIIAFDEEKRPHLNGSMAAAYFLIHRPTVVYFEGQVSV